MPATLMNVSPGSHRAIAWARSIFCCASCSSIVVGSGVGSAKLSSPMERSFLDVSRREFPAENTAKFVHTYSHHLGFSVRKSARDASLAFRIGFGGKRQHRSRVFYSITDEYDRDTTRTRTLLGNPLTGLSPSAPLAAPLASQTDTECVCGWERLRKVRVSRAAPLHRQPGSASASSGRRGTCAPSSCLILPHLVCLRFSLTSLTLPTALTVCRGAVSRERFRKVRVSRATHLHRQPGSASVSSGRRGTSSCLTLCVCLSNVADSFALLLLFIVLLGWTRNSHCSV